MSPEWKLWVSAFACGNFSLGTVMLLITHQWVGALGVALIAASLFLNSAELASHLSKAPR